MHPAFSVILFTTLSGAGFGLWFWLGLRVAFGPAPRASDAMAWPWLLALAGALVASGLVASLWHLGKPGRAWRAFSQWRSSWLSREGVLAVACFLPALWLFALLTDSGTLSGHLRLAPAPWPRVAGALLALLALATVACTAMIYASLTPIPAWRHRLVVPGYLLFAALTGALLLAACGGGVPRPLLPLLGLLPLAAALLKQAYWRDIDTTPLPVSRGDALGVPGRSASVFERPHTEGNYLTREMGFVVARKHAGRLRRIALALFAALPLLAIVMAWLWPGLAPGALALAGLSALLGTLVERWLFFAQARHLVTLYY